MSSVPRDVLHAHGMRRRLGAPTQPVGMQHGVHCGRHFGRFLQVTTPPPVPGSHSRNESLRSQAVTV